MDIAIMDVDNNERQPEQQEQEGSPPTGGAPSLSTSPRPEVIQPVALLMDELKSEDTAIRVEAMRRLPTIALALGPERTRKELLPFLLCSLDEEDEVLAALGEQLLGLVEPVGGALQAQALVPLLEGLVSAEEPFVRTKALAAWEELLQLMSYNVILEQVLPAVQRLAAGDWFSKKCSAASLIALTFVSLSRGDKGFESPVSSGASSPNLATLLADLLKLFESLLYEDTPLVRKAVANNLPLIAEAVARLETNLPSSSNSSSAFVPQLGGFCMQLAADPQDSVRLLSVDPLAVLLKIITSGPNPSAERTALLREKILPLFLSLASDNSWRIRFMVASAYGRLAPSLVESAHSKVSPAEVDSLGIYCALLRDLEGEVRAAACSQLSSVSALYPLGAIEEHVIPAVRLLLSDPSTHVRASLALQLNDFARVLGSARSVELVLPMILQLLRDDASEVRLNVISKLNVIVGVIGIEQLSASLLPAIVALAEDRQWRVRQTIIQYIPELSAHLGRDFFEEKIISLLIDWLEDPVFAVRETAVDALHRVIRQFGPEWADVALLPRLLPLAKHRNYLRRMTLLQALSASGAVVSLTALRTHFLPVLEQLAVDPIANVRFSVARTLQALIPVLVASSASSADIRETLSKTIVPLLQQLQRDSDVDVHDYATDALNLIPVF